MNISEFVEKHCIGKQYDSCVESPCTYASHSGCQHPLHPNNQKPKLNLTLRKNLRKAKKGDIPCEQCTYYWHPFYDGKRPRCGTITGIRRAIRKGCTCDAAIAKAEAK